MENRQDTGGALSRRSQGGMSRPDGRQIGFDPWREMEEMRRRMDAMFARVFGFDSPALMGRGGQGLFESMGQNEPDADVYETNESYIVHAALPGVNPEDIRVEATEDSIAVSAECRSRFPSEGQPGEPGQQMTRHRQSRYSSQSSFQLSYAFPAPIATGEVKASFRNGMLELTLPKQQPAGKNSVPISVNVEGGGQGASQPGQGATGASGQQGKQGTGDAGMREGSPAHKMGQSYRPTAGEDHIAQAQSVGEQGFSGQGHQRGSEAAAPAPGQAGTQKAETASGSPVGASETDRPKQP